jgi:hypothetical protein
VRPIQKPALRSWLKDNGKLLAGWLNDSGWGSPPAEQERIKTLLVEFRHIADLVKAGAEVDPKLRDSVNKKLEHYPYVTKLSPHGKGRLQFFRSPLFVNEEGRASTFADIVIQIAHSGFLDRLRRCAVCPERRWLFSGTEEGECCSTDCRKKKYNKTEQGKRTNRAYRKKYYHQNESPKRFKRRHIAAKK